MLHTLPAARKDGPIKGGKTGLLPSTITIPRLITVAEIIKREYLLAMDAKRMPDLVGLYQYNEISCVENGVENEANEESDEGAEDRLKMLAGALEGKK